MSGVAGGAPDRRPRQRGAGGLGSPRGDLVPAVLRTRVSVGKLAASDLLRTVRETLIRLRGPAATLWGEDASLGGLAHEVGLSSYLISIGGGTDQIQRNIIGERCSAGRSNPEPKRTCRSATWWSAPRHARTERAEGGARRMVGYA